MNARKMLAGAFIVMLGMGMTSFKEDDRNFQISKTWTSSTPFSRNWTCSMSIP